MIGWLGDFLRLWWGLLYWNIRKSWFRLRTGRARCPCQNASDSGRALETGCDAAQMWHEPARFRRVCPLLVDTPDGLRCAVDAAEVRPFWLRAAAYFAAGAGALYVAAVLGGFVLLRVIGYPLSPLTLAWPPRWPQVRVARSEVFAAKAKAALAAHRVNEAVLSLEIAYRNNPRNYDAGLELAEILAFGQPAAADRIFAVLMRDHPGRRAATAEVWYRFLLLQGRFEPAVALAAERVRQDANQRPAWLHALFFLTRHLRDDRPLQDLVDKHAGALTPGEVALIHTELALRRNRGATPVRGSADPLGLAAPLPDGTSPYTLYYQVNRLLELGRAGDALALLERYGAAKRLAEADAFRLRLDVAAAMGRQDLLRQRLQQSPVNARELELISVHLVRHPDAGILNALAACLDRSRLPADAASFTGYTSYLMACGVAQDWDKLHAAEAKLRELSKSRLPQLEAVDAFFQGKNPGPRLESILPALPGLSVEMVYALYDHFGDSSPAVTIKLGSPP